MLSPAEFHARHRAGAPFLLPNAWDLASARWLRAGGFDVVGTTSLGVAVEAGMPDGAGATAEETVELAARILDAGLAVTVDLESGFSCDPSEVARLAARLAALGVVGLNLEDSDPSGALVDPGLAAEKVAAVAAAAPALYLNARTDVFWLAEATPAAAGAASLRPAPPRAGAPLEVLLEERRAEAVRRARRYLEAGADGIFVPGSLSAETIAAIASELPAPLNVLPQAGMGLGRLGELGVARVSTGSLLFRAALGAVGEAVDEAATGRAGGRGAAVGRARPTYAEVVALE